MPSKSPKYTSNNIINNITSASTTSPTINEISTVNNNISSIGDISSLINIFSMLSLFFFGKMFFPYLFNFSSTLVLFNPDKSEPFSLIISSIVFW